MYIIPKTMLNPLSAVFAVWQSSFGEEVRSLRWDFDKGAIAVEYVMTVSRRVDRLRGLGNAIVPQIAHWIATKIIEARA